MGTGINPKHRVEKCMLSTGHKKYLKPLVHRNVCEMLDTNIYRYRALDIKMYVNHLVQKKYFNSFRNDKF